MSGLLASVPAAAPLPALTGLLHLLDRAWPFLVFLLGFSLIVFVHELGHFAAAKWAGVRVERFAIGFGRELFGFTKGETRYSFNILPVGGYVKMLGQEDFDDKAKELVFKDDPRSFVNKPVGRRMVIISAGVIMNTLFACLLFMIVFMIGLEAMGTRIAYVEPDSPAERAGLLPGDIIRSVNGSSVLGFREVQSSIMLARRHEPIELVVERGGRLRSFFVEPKYFMPESTQDSRRLMVGIRPGVTREIWNIGPEIRDDRPDHPHIGDVLVEIDGVAITDDNANEVINMLAYAKGDVYVERKDPIRPDAPPRRVRVDIPPILALFPRDDPPGSLSVLGLSPLVRISFVNPNGRAFLAGLEAGDAVLNWDDTHYPTRQVIAQSIRDSPERDIFFKVQKLDGRTVEGFVRPKRNRHGPGTIQARCEPIERAAPADGVPQARWAEVRPLGRACQSGLESGDVVLSFAGAENPLAQQVQRAIREHVGRPLRVVVRKADGHRLETWVEPEASGSIDATFRLVADDILRVADVVPTINGKPSPAANAGVPPGVLITAVNGRPVSRWRELIAAFRAGAGTTLDLTFQDDSHETYETAFPVPPSLRTVLGLGPEARIVSIDGRTTVTVDTERGREEVSVSYRKGTRAMLTQLIGRTHVPVDYRANPLAPVETGFVDVTADMVDPWLGYVAFAPNIDVAPETTLLKGDGALDAIRIGVHKTYYFILQVYRIMERIIFSRSVGVENISGPLGIFDIGGKVARTGVVEFIFFMAIISANLAVINFLPLPIVDGGLMVFLIIEKIKGSPVSLRVQIATQMIGLFLIIGVFLFVTFNDVMRIWG